MDTTKKILIETLKKCHDSLMTYGKHPIIDNQVKAIIDRSESEVNVEAEVSVRPSVAKFAEVMEKKLKLNDYKGGWEDCNNEYLLTRLEEEAKELRTLAGRYGLGTIDEDNLSKTKRNKVINECADVANFAMMIAENIEKAH